MADEKESFPVPGIMFWDTKPFCLDPRAFKDSIEKMVRKYQDQGIGAVAGYESRGFFYGPPVALGLNCAFVPLARAGQLEGETIGRTYQLENGDSGEIVMRTNAIRENQKVLLIDDIGSAGGAIGAGIGLIKAEGASVVQAGCIIEIANDDGRSKLGDTPMYVLVERRV